MGHMDWFQQNGGPQVTVDMCVMDFHYINSLSFISLFKFLL